MQRLCPTHGHYTEARCPACQRQRNNEPAKQARSTRTYQLARAAAKQRDGHTCQRCGAVDWLFQPTVNDGREYKKLEAHHIDGNPRNHALSNLTTLCADCHGDIDRGAPGATQTVAQPPRAKFSQKRVREPDEPSVA
jgi:hypothetical protein